MTTSSSSSGAVRRTTGPPPSPASTSVAAISEPPSQLCHLPHLGSSHNAQSSCSHLEEKTLMPQQLGKGEGCLPRSLLGLPWPSLEFSLFLHQYVQPGLLKSWVHRYAQVVKHFYIALHFDSGYFSLGWFSSLIGMMSHYVLSHLVTGHSEAVKGKIEIHGILKRLL